MLNSRDIDQLDRMFATDFVNHNERAGNGLEAFKQFWHAMFTGLPDLHATVEDAAEQGAETWARYTLRGTHDGVLLGLPATGRRVEMRTMEIWRFDGGLVVEHWDSVNTLEVLQQVGAIPQDSELFGGQD